VVAVVVVTDSFQPQRVVQRLHLVKVMLVVMDGLILDSLVAVAAVLVQRVKEMPTTLIQVARVQQVLSLVPR
jgi:hypothetical protein